MSTPKSDLEIALANPTKLFKNPNEVIARNDFSKAEKIKILKRWEYDVRSLEVAEEENMGPASSNGKVHLDQILEALHAVDKDLKMDDNSPTKHGGE
ncbi:MAG: hypothetical protein KBD64_05105 [Gammaproteobacteria bacterium]|nr:hypothetical protein [Gammaproteobacteria bacterium]